MKIRVNGEDRDVTPGCTVYRLLEELGVDPAQAGMAVALDGSVVPGRFWKDTEVGTGSEVEIVRALQGG